MPFRETSSSRSSLADLRRDSAEMERRLRVSSASRAARKAQRPTRTYAANEEGARDTGGLLVLGCVQGNRWEEIYATSSELARARRRGVLENHGQGGSRIKVSRNQSV